MSTWANIVSRKTPAPAVETPAPAVRTVAQKLFDLAKGSKGLRCDSMKMWLVTKVILGDRVYDVGFPEGVRKCDTMTYEMVGKVFNLRY